MKIIHTKILLVVQPEENSSNVTHHTFFIHFSFSFLLIKFTLILAFLAKKKKKNWKNWKYTENIILSIRHFTIQVQLSMHIKLHTKTKIVLKRGFLCFYRKSPHTKKKLILNYYKMHSNISISTRKKKIQLKTCQYNKSYWTLIHIHSLPRFGTIPVAYTIRI